LESPPLVGKCAVHDVLKSKHPVARFQALLDSTEPTLPSVSAALRQLSAHLRACGNAYVAAADLCWLYGHTQHWCTPGKQPMVLSKEVPLREDEMAGTAASLREDKLQVGGWNHIQTPSYAGLDSPFFLPQVSKVRVSLG